MRAPCRLCVTAHADPSCLPPRIASGSRRGWQRGGVCAVHGRRQPHLLRQLRGCLPQALHRGDHPQPAGAQRLEVPGVQGGRERCASPRGVSRGGKPAATVCATNRAHLVVCFASPTCCQPSGTFTLFFGSGHRLGVSRQAEMSLNIQLGGRSPPSVHPKSFHTCTRPLKGVLFPVSCVQKVKRGCCVLNQSLAQTTQYATHKSCHLSYI